MNNQTEQELRDEIRRLCQERWPENTGVAIYTSDADYGCSAWVIVSQGARDDHMLPLANVSSDGEHEACSEALADLLAKVRVEVEK